VDALYVKVVPVNNEPEREDLRAAPSEVNGLTDTAVVTFAKSPFNSESRIFGELPTIFIVIFAPGN
jgi:hypothetical protein